MISFRYILFVLLGLSGIIFWSVAAEADESYWHYGDVLFGKLKYGRDFDHYDHANPNAPKGGRLNLAAVGSYNSFNPFIIRGRPPAGLTRRGGLLYDTLFTHSLDQPAASYGLIAEAFRFADDYSWAIYRLDPKAKWHDGSSVTPEDVRWSMEKLKKISPFWSAYYRNIKRVEVTGKNEISFFFDQKNNRELPLIIGDLPVLPKHWWTALNSKGEKRDISKPIAEPPLGSGPYRIGKFKTGKSLTWNRVEDYWGRALPTQKGRYNFDRIRYSYFLESAAIWEAFKKGGVVDIRAESSPRRWVRSYNFPAMIKGNVLRREFPLSGPQIVHAYYLNTRRKKLKNHRVRQALTLLLDFETMNKNLFFNSYKRADSFFEGGELQSRGLPKGRELKILEKYRGKIPDEIFDKEFVIPDFSRQGSFRVAQRQALKLFTEAGYHFKNGKMLDKDGNQFALEFIVSSPEHGNSLNPYFENLKKLGVNPELRVLDTVQYANRRKDFDYDVLDSVAIQSLSPGNEQRGYWGSHAATIKGSSNYSGISNPVIDDLTKKIISAPDRQELVDSVHALDRVLKWSFYTIPEWYAPTKRLAWRHKLKFVDKQPDYSAVDIFSFWIDPEIKKGAENHN